MTTQVLDYLTCLIFGMDGTDFVKPGSQVCPCFKEKQVNFNLDQFEFFPKDDFLSQENPFSTDEGEIQTDESYFLPSKLERDVHQSKSSILDHQGKRRASNARDSEEREPLHGKRQREEPCRLPFFKEFEYRFIQRGWKPKRQEESRSKEAASISPIVFNPKDQMNDKINPKDQMNAPANQAKLSVKLT